MTTTLIIARHGNTFEDGEPLRRVGARTDLPLTEKGRAQATALGNYLRTENLKPAAVFCSELQRTRETAALAVPEITAHIEPIFNEIDYGPDENKTEAEVIARIGAPAIKEWEEHSIVPPGWLVEPADIEAAWRAFAAHVTREYPNGTVLVITSNGIARFAPRLSNSCATIPLKLATGALGILRYESGIWRIDGWNIRPPGGKIGA